MSRQTDNPEAERLAPFIGEWTMEFTFPGAPPETGGRVVFEWMPGGLFLVERWEVPHPDAPDGIAILGWDAGRNSYLQHYFDSRGVARVYEMTLEDGRWTLERNKEDFSPLEFSQRYIGTFSDDGMRIEGAWEIAHDHRTYEKDFDFAYIKQA